MRKHAGMRPQDIAILVKVFSLHDQDWLIKNASFEMHISQSEFSESLHRSWYAGLLDDQKQLVFVNNFYEFLVYGLRYVFPQRPVGLTRGIPTAYAHPDLNKIFLYDIRYVWPSAEGKFMGMAIEPFYAKQVKAIQQDPQLYLVLSLIEILRVGKTREVSHARKQLKNIFGIGS